MSASLLPMVGCRDCGQLFMRFSRDICPICREKEQMLINQIVNYVNLNPRCDVRRISFATGISEKKINDIVHQGLLRRFGLKMFYPCRICGTSVNLGNLCFWCSDRLSYMINDLKESIWGEPQGRDKIEESGVRSDLIEEDWAKATNLFGGNVLRSRRGKEVSSRSRRSGFYR